jgi:hypothetical protein
MESISLHPPHSTSKELNRTGDFRPNRLETILAL